MRRLAAIRCLLCLSVISLLIGNNALADNSGPDPAVTIEKLVRHYIVERDGTFVSNREIVQLINEERAIKNVAQAPLRYNRGLDSLEVIEAYTQKPDGRKVPVTSDMIREQQEPASFGAPMFQDTLIKTVIFPDVAVGDRLVMRSRQVRSTPMFPGHFVDLALPPMYPIKESALIYDMPDDLPLYADAMGFQAAAPIVGKGRRVYRWDYVFVDRSRAETRAVAYVDYGQRLAVSTFADYAGLARAYEARAADKTTITPKLRELASQVSGSLDDPRAQALALSDWVRRNIRYVAVYLGAGGVVPHAAETVLENRYGDCKDHVVLLNALLAARGITGTTALINAGNAFRLPAVPTLGVLDHAIAYIPALDLYLDPTAKGVAAGFLPASEIGKPTVLTGRAVLGETPRVQDDRHQTRLRIRIQPSGAGSFSLLLTSTGRGAEAGRYVFRNLKPADRDRVAEQLLLKSGFKGAGKVDAGKLEGIEPSYSIRIEAQTDNLINLPGPVGVPTLTNLGGGIAENVTSWAAGKRRTQPYVCESMHAEEEARFEFPDDVEIIALPKATTVSEGLLEYSADYAREGQTVTIRRRLNITSPAPVCAPEIHTKLRTAYDAIMRDTRSQIIVQAR